MARTYYLGVLIALVVTTVALVAASLVISVRPAEAASPGENGKIVFASSRTTGERVDNPEGDSEIFTINPDGTGLAQITENDYNDIDPVFSPNGSQIAFSNDKEGTMDYCWYQHCPTTLTHDIYKMNADGSNPIQLTDDPSYDFTPAWSPDGTEIAFESYRDTGSDIYKMNENGTGQTNLTNDPTAILSSPAWSPDGTKIVFVKEPYAYSHLPTEIYTMGTDGSGQTRLARDSNSLYAPAWSPDGMELAFQSSSGRIYKINADGTSRTLLTRTQTTGYFASPAWSPDGKEIAFVSRQTGNSDIYKMKVDGTNPTCLIAKGSVPDWGIAPSDSVTLPPEQPACTAPPPETNTAPTISDTRPASKTRDATPTIRATITDAETDAEGRLDKSSIRLFVDSREISDFSYEPSVDAPSTGKLSYVSRKLKPGRHNVKIEAVDPQGLSVSETWTFKVTR